MFTESVEKRLHVQQERAGSRSWLKKASLASVLALSAFLALGSSAGAQYIPGNYCERGWTFTGEDAGSDEDWRPGCNATATIEQLEPSVEVAVILSRKDEVGGAVYSPHFFLISCGDAAGFAIKDIWEQPFNDVRGFGFNEATGGLNPRFPSRIGLWVKTDFPNGMFAKNQLLECQTANNQPFSQQLIRVSVTLEE